jgi:hypothetical protein
MSSNNNNNNNHHSSRTRDNEILSDPKAAGEEPHSLKERTNTSNNKEEEETTMMIRMKGESSSLSSSRRNNKDDETRVISMMEPANNSDTTTAPSSFTRIETRAVWEKEQDEEEEDEEETELGSTGQQNRASPTSIMATLAGHSAPGGGSNTKPQPSGAVAASAGTIGNENNDNNSSNNSNNVENGHTSNGNNNNNNNNMAATREQQLEAALDQAQTQRTKMLSNIQKKKQLLVDMSAKLKELQKENNDLKTTCNKLTLENASLHSGVTKMTTFSQELKNKLRIKQDVLRETRAEKEDVDKKLKRLEQNRLLEQELLQNYRRLAIHTGYFKWGKEIRMLEAALEKATAEQQQE